MHRRGLDGVLAHLGMIPVPAADPGPGREPSPVRFSRFIWLRCTHTGWWEPALQPGEPVTRGQVLGTVSTLDGADVLQIIEAPTDGVLMFVTSSPAVVADGLVLGLGAR